MPAAFIGHGSPMNTLERNRYTNSWRAFGASVPPPRAILVISAHWFINATAVTAMPRPRVIHDFFGFPDDLFEFDYPAPGHPDLAEEVAEIAKPVWVGLDRDSWGLDHGTWSVLAHAFPEADIPVVQLSVNAMKPLEYHVDLGARLGPLRAKGVLIVGSGNIVHNLAAIDPSMPAAGTEWARRFDDAARAILTTEPGDASGLDEHPDFGAAVPTTDHFVPMLYLAGLAGAAGRPADVMVDGYTFGSLSMTAYTLDAGPAPDPVAAGAGGAIPDPADVPPEDTNI
jgi:4,5-DOPA dioxygenase extradiol